MKNEKVIHIFEKISKIWTAPNQLLTNIPFYKWVRSSVVEEMFGRCFVYPNIRDSFIYKIGYTPSFESKLGETILWIKTKTRLSDINDLSFTTWILTDNGLYKIQNKSIELLFSWSSINRVEIDGDDFCFYGNDDHIFTKVPTNILGHPLAGIFHDETNEINTIIASFLTEMAKTVEPFNYDEYVVRFLTLPYYRRKYIIPISQTITFHSNVTSFFDIDNMPKIIFPTGHPYPSMMYIGHPRKKDVYYPAEGYRMYIIKDQINEFCRIAACLGAKSIDIKYDIEEETKTSDSETTKSPVNIVYNDLMTDFSGGIGFQDQNRRDIIDRLKQSIGTHFEFPDNKSMCLPDDLLWYESEEQWKNMFALRTTNGITHYTVKMVSNKYNYLKKEELNKIEFEMKCLPIKLEIIHSESISRLFESEENVVISIDVEFCNT